MRDWSTSRIARTWRSSALGETQVSDAGLALFKDCKRLTTLWLNTTQVGDAGLANFKDCKRLARLSMQDTLVSDAGLAHLRDCKGLTELILSDTEISDAGLTHIVGLTKLNELILKKTAVTAAGIEQLKKSLPQCKIEWDGGVIQPLQAPRPSKSDKELILGAWRPIRAEAFGNPVPQEFIDLMQPMLTFTPDKLTAKLNLEKMPIPIDALKKLMKVFEDKALLPKVLLPKELDAVLENRASKRSMCSMTRSRPRRSTSVTSARSARPCSAFTASKATR